MTCPTFPAAPNAPAGASTATGHPLDSAGRLITSAANTVTTPTDGTSGRIFLPRLVLPWFKTSDYSSNSRLYWRKRAELVRKQRDLTTALALEAGWHLVTLPEGATVNYRLIYCPPSRVHRVDDDNVLTAAKGARDALADVLGLDDRHFRIAGIEQGEKSRDGAIIVIAEVA